ncbi:MAG: Mur ligase family protein, partial [Spirosomataceae bacterium]
MLLSEILYGISIQASAGDMAKEVTSITFDSRRVQENTLFVAIPGTQVDGHQFIETAISNGATAILCEQLPSQLSEQVTYVQVTQSAQAMGRIASTFYGHPSKKVRVVGVTGTNGKTSIATMLFRLYRHLGYRCGLLSTVQNQIEDEVIPSTHTTPDSVTIQQLLHTMHERGCQYVFMEVSSHAVVMDRIAGIHFAGGVFTNITQDHLDFHGTFANYIKAKQGFFDLLPASAFALTNADDKNGKIMIQNTVARRESYSLKNVGTFKGKLLSCGLA